MHLTQLWFVHHYIWYHIQGSDIFFNFDSGNIFLKSCSIVLSRGQPCWCRQPWGEPCCWRIRPGPSLRECCASWTTPAPCSPARTPIHVHKSHSITIQMISPPTKRYIQALSITHALKLEPLQPICCTHSLTITHALRLEPLPPVHFHSITHCFLIRMISSPIKRFIQALSITQVQ